MAYSRVVCQFPPELNAACYMSDGRALAVPFALDSLEIYPGERFTVLIDPAEGWDGHVLCEFWSMVDHTLESTEHIHIRDAALGMAEWEASAPLGYPNPARSEIQWNGGRTIDVWDAAGRHVYRGMLNAGRLSVSGWPVGTYVARVDQNKPTRFVVTE